MFGPEGFHAQPQEKDSHGEEEVMNRRAFLKRSGATVAGLALGVAGLGVSEDAEARKKERKEQRNVEYVGFRPNGHQKALLETRLKNMAPEALSVEVRFIKDSRESAHFRISVLKKDGRQTDSLSKPFEQRRGENITPALNEALDELESKLRAGSKEAESSEGGRTQGTTA